MDKPEILAGARYGYLHVPLVSPSVEERPLFGLFVSGLNVGLLMASIIASQVAFFVLEVFRRRGATRSSIAVESGERSNQRGNQ